jgi:uncharacterized protein with HEPN domain
MKDTDRDIIKLLQKYCSEILSFADGFEYTEFVEDSKTNKACLLNLEQIGENVHKLSHEFVDKYKRLLRN